MSRMYALGLLVSSSASSGVRNVLFSSQYACAMTQPSLPLCYPHKPKACCGTGLFSRFIAEIGYSAFGDLNASSDAR